MKRSKDRLLISLLDLAQSGLAEAWPALNTVVNALRTHLMHPRYPKRRQNPILTYLRVPLLNNSPHDVSSIQYILSDANHRKCLVLTYGSHITAVWSFFLGACLSNILRCWQQLCHIYKSCKLLAANTAHAQQKCFSSQIYNALLPRQVTATIQVHHQIDRSKAAASNQSTHMNPRTHNIYKTQELPCFENHQPIRITTRQAMKRSTP